MNCDLSTIYGPFSPRGLYAPECRHGTSEDVPCADKVGIAAVIAANAPEHLSRAVAPILRTTFGAGTGRASRIDSDKPHTVILCQLLDPLSHAPVCPRSGGFAETLASSFLLASLEADEIFDADGLQPIPRQLLNGSVDEVIALDTGTALASGAGTAAAHTLADLAEIVAEDLAVAGAVW